MKIYLSNYWKLDCVFCVSFIFMIIIGTVWFCVWSNDPEDYIFIICASFYVVLILCMIIISMKFLRYVVKKNNQLIMYSFGGKKLSEVNYEADIYYEVLPLIEGMCSTKRFIVISNTPFESYRKNGFTQLAKLCKSIDKNGNQIIMPYGKQTYDITDISLWHKVY